MRLCLSVGPTLDFVHYASTDTRNRVVHLRTADIKFRILNAVAQDWENTFASWAKGPQTTEDERSENAIRAIRNAIAKSDDLKHRNIDVFLQGSYRNRVNVRQNSDVDIGILCHNSFFYNLPENYTAKDFNITPSTYHYHQLKNEVEAALAGHFGKSAVHRGNKAFDIKENSYRVEADVAPFFDHRRYSINGHYQKGVELLPDNGGRVINWPEQHYNNGVSKNTATQRRYKRVVRILKRLCINMDDKGIATAKPIPGFLVECLVSNVPDEHFGHNTYTAEIMAVLTFLFNNTRTDKECTEWVEVSGLKWLFRGPQPWTRTQAHAFINDAWDYIGFT